MYQKKDNKLLGTIWSLILIPQTSGMLELRYPAMGVSIIVGSGSKSFHVSDDCSKSIISEVVV